MFITNIYYNMSVTFPDNFCINAWYRGDRKIKVVQANHDFTLMSNNDKFTKQGNEIYLNGNLLTNMPGINDEDLARIYKYKLKKKGYKIFESAAFDVHYKWTNIGDKYKLSLLMGKFDYQAGFITFKQIENTKLFAINTEIVPNYRKQGLGLQMFEYAIDNLPEGIESLVIYQKMIINDKEIPAIINKLKGKYRAKADLEKVEIFPVKSYYENLRYEEDDVVSDDTYYFNLIEDDPENPVAQVSATQEWNFDWNLPKELQQGYEELFPSGTLFYIQGVHVDAKYRGLGHAKFLIQKAIDKAKQLKIDRVFLNADAIEYYDGLKQADLVEFYKKFGFEEILNQGHNSLMLLKL